MNAPTYCIIHCRVSTGKQAYEGESLATQERICRDIAERNGWELAHEPWLEAYSGRKHTRAVFTDVLAYLDRHPGEVRFYVFRAIDRFTRGGVLLYARLKEDLAQRGVELVDSMGVIQPTRNTLEHVGFEYDWSRISPSEIAEVVMATTAKAEVNTILTRLIGQEIALTQQGYKVRQPPDGYINQKVRIGGKRRTVLAPDPERAEFIVAMYELRAAGQLTDAEIVARVNAMGYRRPIFNRWDAAHTRVIGQGGGGPLLAKRLQEIIRRPIYCGVVWEKWTGWKAVKAPYDGLVSVEVWNAANRRARYMRETDGGVELLHDFDPALVGKHISRTNADYPFKNVILCPVCRSPFMGSASRGKGGRHYPAYHCDRKHKRVARRKDAFEQSVTRCIGGLQFTPQAARLAAEAILQQFVEKMSEQKEATSQIQKHIDELAAERDSTVRAFTAASTETMQRALEDTLCRQDAMIAHAHAQRSEMEFTETDVRSYIGLMVEILEHPDILLKDPEDTRLQRSRYMRVFEELPSLEDIEAGTPKTTVIFELFKAQGEGKSELVRPPGLTWNLIETDILRWKREGLMLPLQRTNELYHTQPYSAALTDDAATSKGHL
jgi:site-specific DNA recombinase